MTFSKTVICLEPYLPKKTEVLRLKNISKFSKLSWSVSHTLSTLRDSSIQGRRMLLMCSAAPSPLICPGFSSRKAGSQHAVSFQQGHTTGSQGTKQRTSVPQKPTWKNLLAAADNRLSCSGARQLQVLYKSTISKLTHTTAMPIQFIFTQT